MPRGSHRVSGVIHGALSPQWVGAWRRSPLLASDDASAVTAAVESFIQAWLEGDSERMGRCLHPDLENRLLRLGEPLGPKEAQRRMAPLRAEGLEVRTDVLDVRPRMATALSRVGPWTAYIHLARSGRRWTLVNLLWEWD